ncbi:MAG: CAP domain-containing protein [Sulfurovum sp.]|nr:CAP domain-containing protein [Sulfurovum sp.]
MKGILLLLGFVLTSLLAHSSTKGLDYLNSIRSHTGLSTLKPSKILDKSSQSHAKYLIANQTVGHYQRKDKPKYVGKSPSSRTARVGYRSTVVRENISINTRTHLHAMQNLFSAIYHRFTFLNFISDEIGMSSLANIRNKRVQKAYVYNLGSSILSGLCKQHFTLLNGTYYMKDVCKKSSKMIPLSVFEAKKLQIQAKSAKIIYYPYDGEKEVYPAFYNEHPDPLPRYKVSGFPISVQFNPAYTKKVKIQSFRLYNQQGKEIHKTKLLTAQNDPNHLISPLQFALMPLARLEFAQTYTVVFEALADGKRIYKKWRFKTIVPREKLYRINKNHTTIEVQSGSSILLYMVPSHRRDIILSSSMKAGISSTFLDSNTLKITLKKQKKSTIHKIKFSNQKSVTLKIQGR